MTTLTRRNPLTATTNITLATETNGPQLIDLLPADIHIDAGLQTRDKMSQETITEYAEAMLNGDQFPPLTVFHNGATYALVKGFHRIKAHAMAFDNKPIRCKVVYGNRRDALKEALGDNADHGLRLTREDKRKKIKLALADEEWGQWSDREIAKLCKVSHPLVAEVRREVTGNSSSDQSRTYTTRHGTQATMHTKRISQANSARQTPSAKATYVSDQLANAADAAPPRPLTVDETLAVILRFVERGSNSPLPSLQLDFLRRHTEPRAYLPAVNPERVLDSKCFREAHQQALVLLEAEINRVTQPAQKAPQAPPTPELLRAVGSPPTAGGYDDLAMRAQIVRNVFRGALRALPEYKEIMGGDPAHGGNGTAIALRAIVRDLEKKFPSLAATSEG